MNAQKKIDSILETLQKGISARKYHYSKKESKDCFIELSQDLKSISWYYKGGLRDEKPLSKNLFTKSKFKIADVQQIIYGPYTFTFRAYRLEQLLLLTKSI